MANRNLIRTRKVRKTQDGTNINEKNKTTNCGLTWNDVF